MSTVCMHIIILQQVPSFPFESLTLLQQFQLKTWNWWDGHSRHCKNSTVPKYSDQSFQIKIIKPEILYGKSIKCFKGENTPKPNTKYLVNNMASCLPLRIPVKSGKINNYQIISKEPKLTWVSFSLWPLQPNHQHN